LVQVGCGFLVKGTTVTILRNYRFERAKEGPTKLPRFEEQREGKKKIKKVGPALGMLHTRTKGRRNITAA